MNKMTATALLLATQATAVFGCDLKVEAAWIREAPPNAMALAGYAKLSNAGTATLKVHSMTSAAFASVETHESYTENGLAKMRPVTIEIPAKSALEFAAGGKHFMLMGPRQPLKKGDEVTLKLTDATGCVTSVPFKVTAASAGEGSTQSGMDHSQMDHSMIKHD